MIELVDRPIDVASLLSQPFDETTGAQVLFLGVTRRYTGAKETQRLSYEAAVDLALQDLARLRTEAIERWQLTQCLIVHRLGETPIGEP
ncbi:MAG: molybdenum cofactor biosynthesis protein MoaE, partial [Planctomycetales bacterium]|nr:molybdenum cofactor biosynthesis protein MoaE [Planctomycetales bacterium]